MILGSRWSVGESGRASKYARAKPGTDGSRPRAQAPPLLSSRASHSPTRESEPQSPRSLLSSSSLLVRLAACASAAAADCVVVARAPFDIVSFLRRRSNHHGCCNEYCRLIVIDDFRSFATNARASVRVYAPSSNTTKHHRCVWLTT